MGASSETLTCDWTCRSLVFLCPFPAYLGDVRAVGALELVGVGRRGDEVGMFLDDDRRGEGVLRQGCGCLQRGLTFSRSWTLQCSKKTLKV